jgi:hypothetical protein
VAVKVTFVPEQIDEPELDTMLTEGVTEELTVMVTVLEVAVVVEAHAALDVITQLMVLPFAREALE